MPTLHNPAGHRLFCHRIERILDADERVEITDDEAADLEHNTVFTVEGYGDSAPAVEEKPDDADAEGPPSATPVRETVKRGSKRVEVTRAPEPETRG